MGEVEPTGVGNTENLRKELGAEVDRLRDFAELSSDWFWEQDAEFRFVNFSGVHLARIERSVASVIGLRRWELPIQVPRAVLEAHIEACKRHEIFRDFEYSIPGENGVLQRFSISGKPLFDAHGNFSGYRGVGRNITALYRTQLALQQHEQQLTQIFDGSPVAIFVIDAAHRVTHWNRACEHLTGVRAREVIGSRDAWRGFYDSERPTLCDLVLDGADDATISRYYGNNHGPSGSIDGGHEAEMYFPHNAYRKICWLYFTAAPLYDALGNKVGAIETLQDVTERRRAVQALEDMAEEYALIFDSALTGIAFMKDRLFLRCNRRLEEIFGYPPGGLLGQTSRLLYPSEEEWRAAGQYFNETVRKAGSCSDERRFRRADGGLVWVQVNGRMVRLHGSDYWVWSFQDVTRQHHAEEELHRSHAELEVRVAERTAELSHQLHFMQELIEAIPGPLFYKDRQGAYLGCNQDFVDYLGKPREDIIGRTAYDLAPRHLADVYHAADEALYASADHQIYETRVRSANGQERDVMFHKAVFHDSAGKLGGLIGVMLDISDRTAMEMRLRQSANVFDSTADGVAITDRDGNIVAINRAFTHITGYAETEVLGRNHRLMHLADHDRTLYHEMWDIVHRDGIWRGEVWSRRKDGSEFAEWLTISVVTDKTGSITNYVEVFSDVTPLKRAQERLKYQAHHDELTGLPNRRLFEEHLEKALQRARRENTLVAVLFIDLDRFKIINDTLGHEIGDLVLVEAARRFRAAVRESDTVARMGGDEFVVLLEGIADSTAVARVADKIIESAGQNIFVGGHECRIGASIGTSLHPEDGDTPAKLLKAADTAMYRAKRRN